MDFSKIYLNFIMFFFMFSLLALSYIYCLIKRIGVIFLWTFCYLHTEIMSMTLIWFFSIRSHCSILEWEDFYLPLIFVYFSISLCFKSMKHIIKFIWIKIIFLYVRVKENIFTELIELDSTNWTGLFWHLTLESYIQHI